MTPGDERGGHLIGVHNLKPDRYTPVHVLPQGNGDIVFATIAGSGLLVAHANSIKGEFETIPLSPNFPLIRLEGNKIMYCLFSNREGLEVAYITSPSYAPNREEIISPGGVGEPETFWDETTKEVLKRERKT